MNRREFIKLTIALGIYIWIPVPVKRNKVIKSPEFEVILRDDVPKDTIYFLDTNNLWFNDGEKWERMFDYKGNAIIANPIWSL